jgi:hypothetical protein
MKLINTVTPYLRILVEDGGYVMFQGGKLEIDEDEYGYGAAMAEAQRNPSISIIRSSATCDYCGEDFDGKTAKARLGAHKKDAHFDLWVKEKDIEHARVIDTEVKARAGFACDVCQPIQTFGSAGDLAEHVTLLHTQPPALDDDGNTVGGDDGAGSSRRPGEVEPPKAARSSTRSR